MLRLKCFFAYKCQAISTEYGEKTIPSPYFCNLVKKSIGHLCIFLYFIFCSIDLCLSINIQCLDYYSFTVLKPSNASLPTFSFFFPNFFSCSDSFAFIHTFQNQLVHIFKQFSLDYYWKCTKPINQFRENQHLHYVKYSSP